MHVRLYVDRLAHGSLDWEPAGVDLWLHALDDNAATPVF
jgi:hypothetical protein